MKEELKKRWNFAKKDPNAMDINSMTTEQRAEAMKKGLCFRCGKQGHLNKKIVLTKKEKNLLKRRRKKRSGPVKSCKRMYKHSLIQWKRTRRRSSKRILHKEIWIDASISISFDILCTSINDSE